MNKYRQELDNERVKLAMDEAFTELDNMVVDRWDNLPKPKRLRSCTAWVIETSNYYMLRSYETYVAVIDKRNDTLYDALRIVYGYTATSAQHIAKFNHDYGAGKWGASERVTGR